MDWVSAILKPLFQSIFDTIVEWWKEERAAAAQFEAKAKQIQMDSMVEAKEIEKKMIKAAKDHQQSTSPSEWNKRHAATAGILLFCCLFMSGCFRFYVAAREYKPVIEIPPAPVLEDVNTPFTNRELQIVGWAEKLESMIKEYNNWAEMNNKKNGFTD